MIVAKKEKVVHYQRVGQYLTSGCNKPLKDSDDWSISHGKVTCPECLVAIALGKHEPE